MTLKELESLSFDIASTDALTNLRSDLELLKTKYLLSTSTENGLVLCQHIGAGERARKLKLKYKHLRQRAAPYKTLESDQHSGRPRNDYRYRNHFGRKAADFRKVYH